MRLDDHPTVKKVRNGKSPAAQIPRDESGAIKADWLRAVCLGAGADDVGFVSVDRPELASQQLEISMRFPRAKTLISIVARMNRGAVQSHTRSIAMS